VGLEKLRAWRPSPALAPRPVLVAAALLGLILTDRTMSGLAVSRWRADPDQRAAVRLMRTIPVSASVSAGERFFPHLAQRPLVYVFPTGLDRTDYAFLNGHRLPDGEIARVPARRQDGGVVFSPPGPGAPRTISYQVVGEAGVYLLLRRAPPGS
jgi:hypothetical protein